VEDIKRYRDLRVPRARIRRGVEDVEIARLTRGVYGFPAALPFARVRAVFLRLPRGCLLSHGSAAELYGFGAARGNAVHVTVPAGLARPRVRGVVCHESVLAVPEPVVVEGVPCVPPARCAVDLARGSSRLDAIALLDAALRSGRCDRADLVVECAEHVGLRGVRMVRDLIGLADGRAECAQESHLRLIIADGGLPAPEPQLWVPDAAGLPAYRLDLGYRRQRVGLEYDGRSHLDPARLAADRARHNWLSARGWRMRYFTARDLYESPGLTLATIRALL
jgi:hypothetical protein